MRRWKENRPKGSRRKLWEKHRRRVREAALMGCLAQGQAEAEGDGSALVAEISSPEASRGRKKQSDSRGGMGIV